MFRNRDARRSGRPGGGSRSAARSGLRPRLSQQDDNHDHPVRRRRTVRYACPADIGSSWPHARPADHRRERGGAGGTVGVERAAKSAPDGYTLFQHHTALPAAAALYANLRYDTKTAFETLGLINTGPMVLTSRKTLDVKDAKGLVAWIKAQGDKATVAHAGVGSNSYLCALLLMQVAGSKPSLVPYRGTGPAMNDIVGGQVDVLCDQATTATAQVLSGNIKGYAVTSGERLAALKDVPSYKEAGLDGFEHGDLERVLCAEGYAQADPRHAARRAAEVRRRSQDHRAVRTRPAP